MTALLGLATQLRLSRLMLICGTRKDEGDLEGFASACFAGGVDIMQLRDPSVDDAARLAALGAMQSAAEQHRGLVSVYESGSLAEEFQTDLLHLPERGDPAGSARRHLHEWALIGRSCHSREQVDAALADPEVNYLTVGPVFGGLTPDGGLELVRYTARVAAPDDPSAKPWFAVGGITTGTLDQILSAGARRIAVSRAITASGNPQAAAVSLKDRLRRAWIADPGMAHVTLRAFDQS